MSTRKAEQHSSPKIKQKINKLSTGLLGTLRTLPHYFYLVEAPAGQSKPEQCAKANQGEKTILLKLFISPSSRNLGMFSIFLNYKT